MREGMIALACVLAACGEGSGAGSADAARADAAPIDAGPDGPPSALCIDQRFRLIGLSCEIGGRWQAQDALVAAAGASELVLEPLPGGCRMRYRWATTGCAEEQVFVVTSTPEGPSTITTDGIARCDPAGCALTPSDDACAPGARAGTGQVSLGVVLDEGDLIVGLDRGTLGACAALGATGEQQTWDPIF